MIIYNILYLYTYFLIISRTKFKSAGSAICIIFFKSSVNIIFFESDTKSCILTLNLSEKFENCSLILFLVCRYPSTPRDDKEYNC